jgi:MFS family permease
MSMDIADGTAAAPARVGARARKALWASMLGYAMDGFDLLILGFMLKPISAELGLSGPEAGSLVTWTLGGAVVGGVLFGMLSDHVGRIRVLTWTILLFAIFTGLCALATGYHDLLVYRTVAGIGLGGEFGIGMALAAETWPRHLRARASSYVGLGWQAGVLLAAFATPLLLPAIGWRGMFAVGLVPALVSFLVRRSVEEPESFTTRTPPLGWLASLRLLVKDWATAKLSFALFVLCSVQNFGYFGLMIWLPSYLSTRFGYGLTQSAVWTGVTILGMAAGIVIFGELADRIGRRPAFLAYQAGAIVMVLVYSQLTGPTALLIGGAAMGVFVNGMLGGYGALMSELYPTAARATAQNVLFNLGRAVGGFGPLVVGSLAAAYSFSAAIALLATIYALDMIVTALLIPERRGAALD